MTQAALRRAVLPCIALLLVGASSFIQAQTLTASPASLNFGVHLVGTTSGTGTVTVTNHAASAVPIGSVAASGDFHVASNPCGASIAANGVCSVGVNFQATATGTRTGALTISYSATGSPATISLTGVGTDVGLSPNSLNFGSRTVGTTIGPWSTTLTNGLSTTLTINSMTVAGDYKIASSTCGSTVASKASCSIGVTFTPAATGTRNGSITISDSAPDTPHVLSLYGAGTAASGVTVTISPTGASLGISKTQQFTATVTGSANTAVSWSVDGVAAPGNSTVGTITSAGLYTAPASAGTHAVKATSQADTSQGASATVTVTNGVAVAIAPTSVTLLPSAQQQFTATVSGTSNTTVTWSADGTVGGSAAAGTISSAGLYVAPATTGPHTLTATSQADASKSASAPVSVTSTPPALTGVFTFHYDNGRTGLNPKETVLTPANVNATKFGKLFTYNLDGYVFGQPLYVANLSFASGAHNAVYVATENDSVYALDADGKTSTPLWKVTFTNSAAGITTVPCGDVSGCYIGPNIGITATPVIDPATRTLWVMARTKENGAYFHKLHALDLSTGAEKFNGPITVSASVAGSGLGSVNGQVPFNPLKEHNRPALILVNGVVYAAFASLDDQNPYHGWVIGYAANTGSNTISRVAVYNATANGGQGGIWSVGGVVADASGNLFFETGNGSFNGGSDLGDSFVKLSTSGGVLQVADYFTPHDQSNMNTQDLDLGSGGPLLLPNQGAVTHPNVLVGAGKTGTIYLVDQGAMGHYNASSDAQIVQSITGQLGQVFSTPAYWNNNIYYSSTNAYLKAFKLTNGLLSMPPASQSKVFYGYLESPLVSANGNTNGILWIEQHIAGANGVLRAYDATNLANEIYNSNTNSTRDGITSVPGFGTALVYNGKVYVPTKDLSDSQSQLFIFGLLP